MSSNGVRSGLSFVVSHSAFSSPPIGERHAAEFLRGSHRVAASARCCFQLVSLLLSGRIPTRATSGSRLGESTSPGIGHSSMDRPMCFSCSCASLAASTSPKVSIACGPVDLAMLRDHSQVLRQNTIKSSSILGQAHSFDGSVFDSVLAH